jgi:hypothetical protein
MTVHAKTLIMARLTRGIVRQLRYIQTASETTIMPNLSRRQTMIVHKITFMIIRDNTPKIRVTCATFIRSVLHTKISVHVASMTSGIHIHKTLVIALAQHITQYFNTSGRILFVHVNPVASETIHTLMYNNLLMLLVVKSAVRRRIFIRNATKRKYE